MRRGFIALGVALVFAVITLSFATDHSFRPQPLKQPSTDTAIRPAKETKVTFTGVVKDISDTKITVERTLKDKSESMEFELDKPVENIKTGDKVRISYIKKEGRNIVTRVAPAIAQKVIKKGAPAKEAKPAPAEPASQKK